MARKKRRLGLLRSLSVDKHSRGAREGSILAITLWSLCLLTTFALYLGFGVRQKIILVQQLETRDNLHFIAEAGIKKALLELKKEDTTPEFDALLESWSNNKNAFQEVRLGPGRFTVGYEYLDIKNGLRKFRYGMIDEQSKININKAKLKEIKLLFKTIGLDEMDAQNLSAAIVDWRDSDSELSIPLGSAEDGYYKGLKDPYEAKDADFQVLDEVLLVRGMTKECFDKINNFITVYGQGKININTASREVFLSLGLYESVVDKILAFRNGDDATAATADDHIFVLTSTIVSELSQFSALSAGEIANLSNLISAGNIVTDSHNFMIQSTAQLDNQDAILKIVCVFERPTEDEGEEAEDTEGKIRYWREQLN